MAPHAEIPSLAQLLQTLGLKKFRFLIAGMSAAVLQGVPYSTLDTDIWIDLPPRQYMQLINLSVSLGAEVVANTVVVLQDGSMVNFLYRVDGVKSFLAEYRAAVQLEWLGQRVRVLPLDRILQSKRVVGRPKDMAHIPILKSFLKCLSRVTPKKG